MRTCFRKGLKKYNVSLKSGSGTEDVHKPNLWYFDLLLFLNDQETPRQGRDTITEHDNLDNLTIYTYILCTFFKTYLTDHIILPVNFSFVVKIC